MITQKFIVDYEDYQRYLYPALARKYPPDKFAKHVKTFFGNPSSRRHPELLTEVTIEANLFEQLYFSWLIRKCRWRYAK